MVQLRLASRVVIGAFERADDVVNVLAELRRSGVRAIDVSLLGRPEDVSTVVRARRRGGFLGRFGSSESWIGEPRELEVAGDRRLAGAGPLALVLASSPSTSPTGALVMQGIPQRDALVYADLLKDGKLILLVGVADRLMGERVRDLLERAGAQAAAYYAGRPYGTAFHGAGPGLR